MRPVPLPTLGPRARLCHMAGAMPPSSGPRFKAVWPCRVFAPPCPRKRPIVSYHFTLPPVLPPPQWGKDSPYSAFTAVVSYDQASRCATALPLCHGFFIAVATAKTAKGQMSSLHFLTVSFVHFIPPVVILTPCLLSHGKSILSSDFFGFLKIMEYIVICRTYRRSPYPAPPIRRR